jgi:hypothetical protein
MPVFPETWLQRCFAEAERFVQNGLMPETAHFPVALTNSIRPKRRPNEHE